MSHATRLAARTVLAAEGYLVGFSSPGRPELWVKGRQRKAIARRVRDADEDWVIMPYPEPATATVEHVRELAKRDGIVLNAGKIPEQDPDPVAAPETRDPDEDLL